MQSLDYSIPMERIAQFAENIEINQDGPITFDAFVNTYIYKLDQQPQLQQIEHQKQHPQPVEDTSVEQIPDYDPDYQ